MRIADAAIQILGGAGSLDRLRDRTSLARREDDRAEPGHPGGRPAARCPPAPRGDPMIPLSLDRRRADVLDMVRDFAAGELGGIARELDRDARVPIEAIAQDARARLPRPADPGGVRRRRRAGDPLHAGDRGTRARLRRGGDHRRGPQLGRRASRSSSFGTDEQKSRFLPRLAAGEIGAFCLSEAGQRQRRGLPAR